MYGDCMWGPIYVMCKCCYEEFVWVVVLWGWVPNVIIHQEDVIKVVCKDMGVNWVGIMVCTWQLGWHWVRMLSKQKKRKRYSYFGIGVNGSQFALYWSRVLVMHYLVHSLPFWKVGSMWECVNDVIPSFQGLTMLVPWVLVVGLIFFCL